MQTKENNDIKDLKKDRKQYFEKYKEVEKILQGQEKYKGPIEWKEYLSDNNYENFINSYTEDKDKNMNFGRNDSIGVAANNTQERKENDFSS